MNRFGVFIGMFCFFGISAASAQSLYQRCENRKAEIKTMEDQTRQIENEIANINDRIRDVMQQMADLKQRRDAQQGQKAALERKIRAEEASYKRMCSGLAQCEAHERRIDALKARMAPMSDRLRKIREEIHSRSAEANRLSGEVDRIESSYQQMGCDNLVPGQTADSTIDRCNDLFKRWNNMQADINALQQSITALQGRYQQAIRQMRTLNVELARLTKQMREACSHSERIADLDQLEKEHDGYRAMDDELNTMLSRVKKFHRLKIVKPVIRPKKDKEDKPVIKPKKKGKPVIRPK